MCYIFNCFGWFLDLVQRLITFFLACWMSYAVCLGLMVASMAGVAYGYNYSIAEFLTFSRSDTTVYMRRGQFADTPDVQNFPPRRRSGDEDDAFPNSNPDPDANPSDLADYQDQNPRRSGPRAEPLPNTWIKSHDTRHYAEKLTNYKPVFPVLPSELSNAAVQVDMKQTQSPADYYKLTASRKTQRIYVTSNLRSAVSTMVWDGGRSKIVMRNFQMSTKDFDPANDEMGFEESDLRQDISKDRNRLPPRFELPYRTKSPDAQEISRSTHDTHRTLMRHWSPTPTPLFQDYSEDIDEERVVYKPV